MSSEERQENYLLLPSETRSRSGEPFQLCLARSLSSHLRGVRATRRMGTIKVAEGTILPDM